MDNQKKKKLIVYFIISWIAAVSCQLSNPLSSIGRTLENIVRSIARSISF